MLRVTVELWPDGLETGRKVLASANIGRVKSGALADYRVELGEEPHGTISGTLLEYPRFATPIWDLVARAIAIALTGKEDLPPRSTFRFARLETSRMCGFERYQSQREACSGKTSPTRRDR
ncbi:MAG: hypothetical protein WCA85_15535 [Paraburkholderia sp.]|uniref:hypothetical protein n=1 Tax=Paraburkholderia sp. TaxID=1926495 RepID=UPI003C44EB76